MQKQSIFISYSHQDETYKDLATKFLKSANMQGSFKAWSDRNIEIGSQWETEIGSAIDHAKAAIFLISENFKCLSFLRSETHSRASLQTINCTRKSVNWNMKDAVLAEILFYGICKKNNGCPILMRIGQWLFRLRKH